MKESGCLNCFLSSVITKAMAPHLFQTVAANTDGSETTNLSPLWVSLGWHVENGEIELKKVNFH